MPSFKEAPEYPLCTPKEQKWLQEYLEPSEGEPFDLIAATQAAFQAKDEDTAMTYGQSVIGRKRIQAIVNFASPGGGLPTLEEFKREVWTNAKTTKDPKLKFDSLTLYADLEGWRVRGVQKPVRAKDATGEGGSSAIEDLQYEQR